MGERGDPEWFPPIEQALREPQGLLAAGGDLGSARILAAYERGIFPWYSAGQPILWWSPDPRMVLFPGEMKCSRSLRRRLRSGSIETRLDTDFAATIRACAEPRRSGPDTWLNPAMIAAYEELYALGYAHSIESYQEGELVGGLYGLRLGGVFFGESMWSRVADASKVALVRLVEECLRRGIHVIDCQVASTHLASLGARELPRREFAALLAEYASRGPTGSWAAPEGV
ncbi:MAG: leucyl/phenylalanyl-tRNA--protein transferase [Gammaproteobacteria bacterium]|nr:leucyl/phenylalanyl-tRNA--protein transferase [Gammaproteobacteria bacterium]